MEKPGVGKRLVSMLVDHIVTSFILVMPVFLILYLTEDSNYRSPTLNPGFQFVFLGLMLFYFAKDGFRGRSLAKRLFKLQVVDHRTNRAANPVQCFIRNLLILLWPLEVLITIFSPQRRLGDLLAGTRVVNYGSHPVPSFEFE